MVTPQKTCQVCGLIVGDDESGPWVAFQALYVMRRGHLPGSVERDPDHSLFSCHHTCLAMMVDGELAALSRKPRVDKGKPTKKK